MSLPAYASNRASFPEMYEHELVPYLFQPWAQALLEETAVTIGDRVLDVACGTGIVARLAKERVGDRGQVIGVDLSPQMLAVARAVAPTIDWREGSAAALPIADGTTFDVVLCQQGIQFFPDKPAAVREMRRVVAPNGRVGIAAWQALEENPFFRELHQIAERHLGPVVDQRHAFGDATAFAALLVDAGFHDVSVTPRIRSHHFPEGATFLRLNTMALVGMSGGSKSMDDDQRAKMVSAIMKDSAGHVQRYLAGNALVFEISSNVATARG